MDEKLLESAHDAFCSHLGSAGAAWAAVLGSGWSRAAQALDPVARLAYAEIPGLGNPQVPGHEGMLYVIKRGGQTGLIFAGRRHLYEGLGCTPAAIPVYLAHRAGARTLLLTNAAGAVNSTLQPGDLMLVEDHINMTGISPLEGSPPSPWHTRFPDQSCVYAPELCRAIRDSAEEKGIALAHGIYLATMGPNYETPAEVRMFRSLGADAVGMSTVVEAILANAAGMRVGAVSCITNPAAGNSGKPLSHDDVLRVTTDATRKMTDLLCALTERLGSGSAG